MHVTHIPTTWTLEFNWVQIIAPVNTETHAWWSWKSYEEKSNKKYNKKLSKNKQTNKNKQKTKQ